MDRNPPPSVDRIQQEFSDLIFLACVAGEGV
jgi:hypothetical protein